MQLHVECDGAAVDDVLNEGLKYVVLPPDVWGGVRYDALLQPWLSLQK